MTSSNENKRIAKNTILLYIRMVVLVLISLYTSRIVFKTLGVEDFGIYNVVGGIITFIGFLSGSLSGASSRYITFALGKAKIQYQKIIFNNIISIHIIFAIIILILGETIGLWFAYKLNIPENREFAALCIYHISVFTAAMNFIMIPYNASIIAHEKMSTFAYLSIADATLKLSGVFILSFITYDKLIFYAIILFTIQLLDILVYIIYCLRNFKETRINNISINKKLFKEIFKYAGWTMGGNLAIFGYTQGLNILLNIFFNPIINAARGVAVQIQTIINNFSNNFQVAISPQITKSYAQENLVRMHELIIASSKFATFLLLMICIPLMINIKIVLKLWLGEYPEYTTLFLRLILVTSILFCIANPIKTAVHATGNLKKFQLIEGSTLLSIVPISYILLKVYCLPPETVFIVHIIIEIITQIIRVIIVLPMIKMCFTRYLKQVVIPILKVTIVTPILPVLVHLYIQEPDTILSLLTTSFMSLISSLIFMYILGCNTNEKAIIKSKITNILKYHQHGYKK